MATPNLFSGLGTPPSDLCGLITARLVMHPSTSETAAGNTVDFDLSRYRSAAVVVDLTGFAGTSVTFVIQAKDADGGGKYFTHVTSAAETTTKTIVYFLDEQSAALPTAPAGFEYVQAHPLTMTVYRLQWTGSFTSAAFSAVAYLRPV